MQPNSLAKPLFDLWGFNYSTSSADPVLDSCLHHADITMLHDDEGLVAAMHPAGYRLNIEILKKNFNRQQLSPIIIESLHDMITPLKPDAIELVIDITLFQPDNLCFELPNQDYCLLLEQPGKQFLEHNNKARGKLFAQPVTTQQGKRLRERISHIGELPAMPEMAYYLLELRNNPGATIQQLVEIIECDALLAAQVIRYANFSQQQSNQPVETTHDAIFKVIGFENAIFICLGSIIAKEFKLAEQGPLGLNQWKQSVYCAALAQQLLSLSAAKMDVKPGLLYLSALLHNIGVMILARLFHNEYLWLNQELDREPLADVFAIEKQRFGITHNELGSLLMLEWCLPLAMSTTALEHHVNNYQGPYQDYVYLVQAAITLLKNQGSSGAADIGTLPEELKIKLALDDVKIQQALSKLLECSSELERSVMEMAG